MAMQGGLVLTNWLIDHHNFRQHHQLFCLLYDLVAKLINTAHW